MIASIIFVSTQTFAATVATSAVETYDPRLQAATSCAQVEETMEGYLKNYWNAGAFGPVSRDGMIMNTAATKEAISMGDGMGGGG